MRRFIFGLILCVGATAAQSSDDVVDVPALLHQYGQLSESDIERVMSEPLPLAARKEIEYGFVSEGFVRFLSGAAHWASHIPKNEYQHAERANPLSKANQRYDCASEGLVELKRRLDARNGSWSCIWLWRQFLQQGAELSFDLDFPLIHSAAPWENPSPERVLHEELMAARVVEAYEFPARVVDEVVSLKYGAGRAAYIEEQLARMPAGVMEGHFQWVRQQPDSVQRYGRLVCTASMPPAHGRMTPWVERCYAYWYLFFQG